MKYLCGCEASGDNVAPYCPIHGDAEASDFRQCVRCLAVVSASTLDAYGHKCGQDLWQPISSAPKDTDVLVCDDNGRMTVAMLPSYGWSEGRWQLSQAGPHAEDGDLDRPPAHWMELPEAPEKASKYLDSIKSVYVHWSESNLINSELGNVPEDSGDILKEVDAVAFDNLVKRAAALVQTGYDKTSLTVTFKDGKVYGANGGCKFYLTKSKDSLMKLIEDEG